MRTLTRRELFVAEFVKQAKKIEGRTLFVKMLCYLEKERGVPTEFKFNPDGKHGHFDPACLQTLDELIALGLVRQETEPTPYGPDKPKYIYYGTDRLNDLETRLTPKERRQVKSILDEYLHYSSNEITHYDHDVYRDKRRQPSTWAIKSARLEEDAQLIKETGSEEKALELLLARASENKNKRWARDSSPL